MFVPLRSPYSRGSPDQANPSEDAMSRFIPRWGLYAPASVLFRSKDDNTTECQPEDMVACLPPEPPWRQPRANSMVSLVNPHTNATSQSWHLWEIDLRFALNLTPGWVAILFGKPSQRQGPRYFHPCYSQVAHYSLLNFSKNFVVIV